MKSFCLTLVSICVILSSICTANHDRIDSGLVNKLVERKIDLTSHLVKVSSKITLENTGNQATSYFIFAIEASFANRLSFIEATTKGDDDDVNKLNILETSVSSTQKGAKFWRVELPSSLSSGQTISVTVDTLYSHALEPYPAEIKQADKQLVRFVGNLYHYSPYVTSGQTTVVTAATNKIESYTKTPKPVSVSEATITYGPYDKKEAFSQAELSAHYENNSPFLTVTEMTRLIEVSHWGNIAVEESLDLVHSGAKLKGSFSRYDYQRSQDTGASVKSFKTVLPSSARDVYYRDEIGNISTSNLRESDEAVEIELRPRFPLYGGWKTHYLMGYNVPSYQYLFNSGQRFALKMRFIDHIFDDQVIDRMTLKIILPEGAKDIQLKTPFAVKELPRERLFTYLDTMGRPVIMATKSNLVEQHSQDFELTYTFDKLLLLQEPLLVVGAFWILFAVVIIYVRLDFSITKDQISESKMRVASFIEQIQSVFDKRSALYQAYEDAINKYKSSKDQAAFTANRKKVDHDHKQLTEQLKAFQIQLKGEGSDAAEKVGELNKLDLQYKDIIGQTVTFVEKLISGKMSKPAFIDTESSLKEKEDDLYQKMEHIVSVL